MDEAVQGKMMKREKQKTKDRCLRSIAIFGRAIFYIVQEDRKPIKPYQRRNCLILHAGKFTVYPKEDLKTSWVWRIPVLWVKAGAPDSVGTRVAGEVQGLGLSGGHTDPWACSPQMPKTASG